MVQTTPAVIATPALASATAGHTRFMLRFVLSPQVYSEGRAAD